MQGRKTKRRFRICNGCGEQFHTVRSAQHHVNDCGEADGYDNITITVRE